MITVILAGGSGTRLWPLSTSDKPKHLLALSGEQTMIQDTFMRAQMAGDEVYVLVDAAHKELVKEQLGEDIDEDHLIIQPEPLGTAPCIALALAYISARHEGEATVAFMHADHHIVDKDAFVASVDTAKTQSERNQSLALIGIAPNYPATGFGYIQRGELIEEDCYWVSSFKEKPDQATAEAYIASGEYYWNLGLFAAPLGVFVAEIERHAPSLHEGYKSMRELVSDGRSVDELYGELEEQGIEPAVIEKSSRVVVVEGGFDWMDIGSFKDLYDSLPKSDENSNALEGNVVCVDATDSIVIEQTDRPVAVMGLDNVAVISTDKGLLVCHKQYSQQVKQAVELLKDKESD